MHKRLIQRVLGSFLVCILGVVMLGAVDGGTRFGKLGHEMMCVCGCGQILLECNHVGCPDSSRMIDELHAQTDILPPSGGGPGVDTRILNWFVAKYGATVLAAPIRGGFDIVAWVMPLSVFVLAIIGTGVLVRVWTRKRHTLQPATAAGIPGDDALRDRIRRETQY